MSGAAPLAGGVSMPAVSGAEGVAGAGRPAVALCHVWPSDLGDRRHDLPGHADALDDVTCCRGCTASWGCSSGGCWAPIKGA